MKNKYKCLSKEKKTTWDIKGTNLGGLFILEPWITPSLFYQFLNENDQNKIAMDTYSFCRVLGPVEGKRQLQLHYSKWVNESHIKSLSKKKITHVRIPVGDWMFQPYGPYVQCTDGSHDYLHKIMDWCSMYSIKVLLDLHAVKDSQNGLDNSGQSSNLQYVVAPINKEYEDTLTFIHWPIIAGNWIGKFDTFNKNYSSINYDNIKFTTNVLYQIINTFQGHPALFGIEPLNEPWIYTPENMLKDFYYDIYQYISTVAPHLKFIYHNSFRENIWKNFLPNCSNVALDWHIYQAWNVERYGDQFLLEADNYNTYIQKIKDFGIELIIGEYSLATDNCAMWLNGFQDNLEGYPITPCKYAPCPFPYIDVKDFNRVKNILSPFGSGLSTPLMGTCPYEGILITDDNFNYFMNKLNIKKLNSFSDSQGWFFWNFRTEFDSEVYWSFEQSYENGLFKGSSIDPLSKFNIYNTIMTLYVCAFFSILIISTCIYFKFKKQRKQYTYIQIEIPEHERSPFNVKKKNASTGNFNKYQSVNV